MSPHRSWSGAHSGATGPLIGLLLAAFTSASPALRSSKQKIDRLSRSRPSAFIPSPDTAGGGGAAPSFLPAALRSFTGRWCADA